MSEQAKREKPQGLERPVGSVGFFGDHAMVLEGIRVATQVRIAHLERQGRTDSDAAELHRRTKALEDFVDGLLGEFALRHPTAEWWRRVNGCHLQIMGKVLAEIEGFGCYYPEGDTMIPPYVRREAVADEAGKRWVWVAGIERFATPSKLYCYAGLLPGMGREKGKLRESNTDFRTVLYRLMQFGFLFSKNRYYDRYVAYKSAKLDRLARDGVRVLPTPKGKFCGTCMEERNVPATTRFCPQCNAKLGRKDEPEGVLWQGHLDNMCRRWTVKLFLTHLWVVWRAAEGLPLRVPYAIEHMPEEHTTVTDPWEMCDLPESLEELAKIEKPARVKKGRKTKPPAGDLPADV